MILVTGATGQTGGELVRRLSSRGVAVRALVRNRDKAAEIGALPHVELAVGDMSRPETLDGALRGVTRAMLVSSSEPSMQDVQCTFTDACARAKVAHVVKLSGIVAELDSPFRFARMHAAIEKHIERSGMAYTHLRAGEFMHSYFRQASIIASNGILPLPMGDARIAPIDVADVAAAAAVVLTTDGHENEAYALTGPEALSMNDVAERLSRAIGRPVRYLDVSPEDARAARIAARMPPFLVEALDELFAERRKGKESVVHDTLARVFDVKPTTFEAFARMNASVFAGTS
jgi:uncharacterized protein YbjT (DUF2867 family)